jgi:hypothetical protein
MPEDHRKSAGTCAGDFYLSFSFMMPMAGNATSFL